jgi:hypothetical protein
MTIEEYLAELRRCLRVGPFRKRRIVREIEAHLVEAASDRGEDAATTELGSPRLLARRFKRGRPSRGRWAAAAVLAALALGAVAASVSVFGGGKSAQPLRRLGDGSIAALDANPAPPEPVPGSELLATLDGHRVLADRERTMWVARGKGNSVCLVVEDGTGSGTGCIGRSALTRGPLYVALQQAETDSITVVGLVDDAVTAIEGPGGKRVVVRRNAFAFNDIPGRSSSIRLKLFTARGFRTFEITGLQPRGSTVRGSS